MFGSAGWRISVNSFRADATNSQVWQKCKLHTTEVESAYTGMAILPDTPFEAIMATLESRKYLGDLQVVTDSSAAGTLGCLRKQMVWHMH